MSKSSESIPNPLSEAFNSFNATVSSLGISYQELTNQIQELNLQIAEKNRQLEDNLYEVNRLKRFLDSILNSMHEAVVVIDTEGCIVLFNGSAEQLSGYTGEEALGRKYADILGHQVSERFSPLYTLSNGKPLLLEEKVIRSKRGEAIPVRYSTSLMTDNLNRTIGVVEVMSDLSRIKRLEDEMQRIKTQSALNQMAELVAHEIRNPMGGIRGYVELLAEALEKDDPKREMIDHVVSSVKRLDTTIANFQLFARPVKPNFQTVELMGYLHEVLNFFEQRELADQKTIHLVFKSFLQKDALDVRLDPMLMEHAIMAILDNAAKAMQTGGGTIRVEVQEGTVVGDRQQKILITISDTGEGMSAEVQKQLFTPFFTTREKGMGLGLALARNFILFHQGNIHVDSQPGQGSSVTIMLPKE